MATYSPQDQHHAFIYASEKLRQEEIYRLKMTEPSVYAFIDIEEIKNGWKNKAGLVTEPGQKLAPYRSITYDTSKLDCEAFSCIPVDMLRRPPSDSDENTKVSACSFAEHTTLSFPVKDVNGKTIRTFTACGPGCYRRSEKRDPHTGLPEAEGVLMTNYTNPDTGEKMCQYLNQNLILWSAIPWSRSGKEIEGYNTVHVPGFGFEAEGDGKYDLFNNVGISRQYCNFFKQYYDEDKGECYRSGWMKFVKFTFGQYITNLSYDLVNPPPDFLGGKLGAWSRAFWAMKSIVFAEGEDSPIVTAGVKPSRSEKKAIIGKHSLNFDRNPPVAEPSHSSHSSLSPQRASRLRAEEMLRQHFGGGDVIDAESAEALMELIGEDRNASDKLMELSDSIVDAALRLEVMGLDDKQSRRLMLKEMLNRSRQPSQKGGFSNAAPLSHSLKLVGITLAIKKSLFSRRATERRRFLSQEQHGKNNSRWSPEHVTERDALLLAKASIEVTEQEQHSSRPLPFFDIIPAKDINWAKAGTSADIYASLLRKFNLHIKRDSIALDHLKGFVVKIVRQFLDILEGKIFMHGYEWENNVPLMIGADVVLRKVMAAAGKLCTKFATTLEQRAVSYASDYIPTMAAKVTTDVASRVFGAFLEESVIEIVVSAALRTAIQAFAVLAEMAASAITVIGIFLLVVSVLGAILDLSLQLGWYDQVMKPIDVNKAVKAFEQAFAQSTHSDAGVVHPVSAEEIVAIDVQLRVRNEGEILKESSDEELTAYLEKCFHESPLLGKSSMAFMQEAAEEYLAGRTMNAFGQRIIHSSDDGNATTNQRARMIIAETGKALQDYSKVVNYNASRLNYVGDKWVKNVARQGHKTDVLFRKTVAFSAVAGFALVVGVGAATLSHITLTKSINIGISLAFVGLLVFITLTGIAFINLNAMGEVNADAVRSLDQAGCDKSDAFESNRVGTIQRFTGTGARFNMVSDFVSPMLQEVESKNINALTSKQM